MRTSHSIRQEIEGHCPSQRIARTRALALRGLIEEREALMQAELIATPGGHDPDHVGNSVGYVYNLVKCEAMEEITSLQTALRLVESSENYKLGIKAIDTLQAELDEALAHEQKQREIEAELERKVGEALELAEAKAKASIDKDPAVKAAREELKKAAGRLRTATEIAADPPETTVPDQPVTAEAPGIGRVKGPQDEEDAARELAADLH